MMNLTRLSISFLLLPTSWHAFAEELPGSIEEAERLADRRPTDQAMVAYNRNVFMPYWSDKYSHIINRCLRTLPSPDKRYLSIVVVLNRSGRVIKVYRNADSNVFLCMNEYLSNDTFPAPPVAPYFAHFKIPFPQ